MDQLNDQQVDADKIFEKFKSHSIAEFFKKNKQMLGYSGMSHSMVTIVHEYVTNSLDACEESGILPSISVQITNSGVNKYEIKVSDNGPGIPKKYIGEALATILTGTKFNVYKQQRGQQGVGAAGCTLFANITSGKPVHVISRTDSESYECDLSINYMTNEPKVENMHDIDGDSTSGLAIIGIFGDVKYENGDRSVYEYLKRTALANPNAEITFIGPDSSKSIFPRSTNEILEKAKEVKPHPLGLSINDIIEFSYISNESKISSFLRNSFARVSDKKIDELKGICDIDWDKNPKDLTWDDAEKLVEAFKRINWVAPDPSAINVIGEKQMRAAMENILNPDYMSIIKRKPSVFSGGIPFIIEAAIAFGGNSGKTNPDSLDHSGNIIRSANKVPLLFDSGSCAITEAVKRVNWKRYGIDVDKQPISIMVNMSSIYIPYSGVGKESIQQDELIVNEIKGALMECARSLQHYINGQERVKVELTKYKTVMKYTDHLSKDLGFITKIDSNLIKDKLESNIKNHYLKYDKESQD